MAALAAVGLVLVAAACAADQNPSGPGNSAGLSNLLPDRPGSGLSSSVLTEQTLDADGAATAVPSDTAATAQQLAGEQYRTGFTRVWGATSTFVSMTVLAFGNVDDAERFVTFERTNLAGAANTFVTTHAAIPGSYVFVISSSSKAGGGSLLCNGVWFRLQVYAFESLACSPTPVFASQVEAAARSEYQHARSHLGA